MRVMVLMGGGDVGGAKTHIMSLNKALSKEHQIKLISFREGPFPEEAKAEGIDVEVISTMNIWKARRQLLKIAEEMQPEVIHCHGAKANMMGILIKRVCKVPVMTTVHSDYRLDYLGTPVKQYTYGTINALALRMMDFYQPVADRMARTLIQRGFDPDRICTIYNGMDLESPLQNFDRTAYCREKYGVEVTDDMVLCGIAARLTAVKDITTTLKAFALAVKEQPRLRLFIAGEGEDKANLQKMTKELGIEDTVVFCGWVNPIKDFFAAMDVTLLSSISETFPYSILEGIGEGCVSICSDVGGMSELIDSGENGFIFQPKDYKTFGKQLAKLAADDELRHTFAKRLYEKTTKLYSLKNMCETQVKNYRSVIEKYQRYSLKKDGVVVCGAYGKGNAGDEAVLKAITQEIRQLDPNMPIWVMSRRPLETRVQHRTNAVYTFSILQVAQKMRRAKVYINGGGSLIQDVTSSRSLWYYLYSIGQAKRCGCHVVMYGCGIGPVHKRGNQKWAAKVINEAVDIITLRDDNSKEELRRMGVSRPDIRLSADPTLILQGASRARVDEFLEREGIPPEKKYICFALRRWKGFEGAVEEIARTAEKCYERYGLTPLFLPVEYPSDLEPADLVAGRLHCPYYKITKRFPLDVTIGLLSRMETVVGMRLHSLMFAAGRGVPVVGISYDVKVDSFLKYIASDTCIKLQHVDSEELMRMVDNCVSGKLNEKVARTAAMLAQRENENMTALQELLK
jgi:polysaccharide pyruvyl transferase CsaB